LLQRREREREREKERNVRVRAESIEIEAKSFATISMTEREWTGGAKNLLHG